MEYSQINALFKRNHNDYELWNLTLPREKIQKIRQVQEDISGDLRQIFEELMAGYEKVRKELSE